MADKSNLIQPPKRVSEKVRRTGGPSAQQAIMRALNAAEDLMENYQGWAVDDLTKLWRTFEGGGSAADIEQMFEIAHGIRGEGGTFGFPLVSIIADSLCKFLEGRRKLGPTGHEVVKVHILAMRAVFRQKLDGAQPKLEGDLRQLLSMLRERLS